VKALLPFGDLESVTASVDSRCVIGMDIRNLMGVKIPVIKESETEVRMSYSLIHTSAKLDESAADFNEAFNKLLTLIESEEALRRIGEEISKIKRRTNALEYILIPNLKHTQAYIRFMLEELERENFFRLKIIKRKR